MMLMAQVTQSLGDPRAAMRWLAAQDLPRLVCWQALALSALLGVFVNHLGLVLTVNLDAAPRDAFEAVILMNAQMMTAMPYIHAIVFASILVIAVFALYWVSRVAGGTGGFGAGILLVAWVNYVHTLLVLGQLALALVSPAIGAMASLLVTVLSFWIFTNFIAELHGFRSLFKVFVMILATAIGMLIGVSFLLMMIGFGAAGPTA